MVKDPGKIQRIEHPDTTGTPVSKGGNVPAWEYYHGSHRNVSSDRISEKFAQFAALGASLGE